MAKRIEKANLPTKTCPVCGRPFTWRKKWAKAWDAVIYCSERCRRATKGTLRMKTLAAHSAGPDEATSV